MARPAMIEAISTVTSKGQTTMPLAIRRLLALSDGAKIKWTFGDDGVRVQAQDAVAEEDPVVLAFLDFLAADAAKAPKALVPLDQAYGDHLRAATRGIAVDLDAPIEGPVKLSR